MYPVDAPDEGVYKTLLESTRAIPWRIDWQAMRFSYIGPQIEELLGWPQDSWVTVEDWASRIHEEDRERVVQFCVSQSQNGIDHEADYRALKADGGYIWMRDVVHVIRKDGEVEALVGFMFDIDERKKTEQALQEARRELEELSFKDGLTGVANRRMLDTVLAREWESARRDHMPISLLLLDIHYFKAFNDHYGHLAGDDCLRRVAQILTRAGQRPRDLAARFGGEEFVLVLPDTDGAAAEHVARRVQALLEAETIPHAASSLTDVVTASVGVATMTPVALGDSDQLIANADRMLYQAKAEGRNRIVSGADL